MILLPGSIFTSELPEATFPSEQKFGDFSKVVFSHRPMAVILAVQ